MNLKIKLTDKNILTFLFQLDGCTMWKITVFLINFNLIWTMKPNPQIKANTKVSIPYRKHNLLLFPNV